MARIGDVNEIIQSVRRHNLDKLVLTRAATFRTLVLSETLNLTNDKSKPAYRHQESSQQREDRETDYGPHSDVTRFLGQGVDTLSGSGEGLKPPSFRLSGLDGRHGIVPCTSHGPERHTRAVLLGQLGQLMRRNSMVRHLTCMHAAWASYMGSHGLHEWRQSMMMMANP